MRVAIIGAGVAGLAAARSLQNNGINVTLFDKSRGPGGRMATRRIDDLAFDHGAQYFTVRDDRFRRQVHLWLQEGIVKEWRGSIGSVKNGTVQKKSVSTVRYVGAPRMSAITRSMSARLDIKFKTRIIDSHFDGSHWEITDENQMTYGSYDALVITTPPTQALPFLDQSPALKREIECIIMQPCWAVMASFNRPLPLSSDGLFVEDSPLSWICRNNSKPGRPESESWVLHGSPEWSSDHLEKKPDEILPLLLTAFFEATGLKSVKPDFAKAHRWRYALAENPLTQEYFWDEENRLAVCGDWCNGSRIEGAYLSGVSAAGRLAGLPDALQKPAPREESMRLR
ncbi:MAG: FAD-dependent oxidoreductase [Rhodothermaceae bacterium]|nr:FAD-dependent oxidoreductase [Rhodothermaceae bacterium]